MATRRGSAIEYDTDVLAARAAAQAIDVVVTVVLLILALSTVNSLVGLGITSGGLLFVSVAIGYGTLLEGFWNGQTVGKWIVGLQVRTEDGSEVRPIQALIRNIPAPLLNVGLPGALTIYTIAESDLNQRVFDQVADTIVVRHY